ncbi:MAG: ATP-dependent helicase, partial [Deltaproteobacteria bacterium]|nr:ATP-dependent helicase [Deltaproteobacteria bacterium]
MKKVVKAFSSSQASGLFALAASNPDAPLSPVFAFWRDFACRYLTLLCRSPESGGGVFDSIDPPQPAEIKAMQEAVPPMLGGEYLNVGLLQDFWIDLDGWVRKEIASSGAGLSGWLKRHAPMWQQVGRVCFHLAENKRDPQFPFAFLATYAPRLSRGGQVQYQPLGRALQEYAGERNKKALIGLLSPVQAASEKSPWIRNLVDSGDVFHPLAWSPRDAYRFLQEVPLLEESGLLVRLPDWWQSRPRPRVVVTMGEKRQSRLGADTMLDFQVELALGEERLTKAEWLRLMESQEGLVNLKGKWVEVDREKLSEALAHWKRVEKQAGENGISFLQGMRLLAGASSDLETDGTSGEDDREWAFVKAGDWLSGVLEGLRNPDGLDSTGQSKVFRGTLRPYQAIGHEWLRFLTSLGLGACLADDMGLGKTIQILSLLASIRERKKDGDRPSLLVLPASLIANWRDETRRFAPDLRARFVHPSETDRTSLSAMAEDPSRALAGCDLVLTSYGMLLRQKWLLETE